MANMYEVRPNGVMFGVVDVETGEIITSRWSEQFARMEAENLTRTANAGVPGQASNDEALIAATGGAKTPRLQDVVELCAERGLKHVLGRAWVYPASRRAAQTAGWDPKLAWAACIRGRNDTVTEPARAFRTRRDALSFLLSELSEVKE